MTETTTVTITQEITIPVITEDEKIELGGFMLSAGLAEWSGYDDYGNFEVTYHENGVTVFDPDGGMEKAKYISYVDFFEEHFRLIWLAQISNYRHDWLRFAFRAGDEDMTSYDEYDSLTCEAVLQNMLYGEIVYG